MWHVYVLECTTRGGRVTLHVGVALDVYARAVQHCNGRVKATRGRAVRLLAHSSPMPHGDALRREAELKRAGPEAKRAVVADWRLS
jgi:predicted GIY-YIG superfamily endonuclease